MDREGAGQQCEIIKGNEAELPTILLHSANAVPGISATGSSLASLPYTPVGLWSYSVPQHGEDSHCLSDSEKAQLLPNANTSEI